MKTVKHYGANAVEVDGILVSYETRVARIGSDGSFHRLVRLLGDYHAQRQRVSGKEKPNPQSN